MYFTFRKSQLTLAVKKKSHSCLVLVSYLNGKMFTKRFFTISSQFLISVVWFRHLVDRF